MFVDGGFVLEDLVLLGAVDDAHDIDVSKLRSAFTPVGVGHAVVATDFAAGFLFATFGDSPVEESVEARDALSGVGGLDVFEEGGEAADDFAVVERFGDVNIMGVLHGTDKDLIMQHKAAIDAHLEACEIPLLYTNVFWGGRSEIKPSEISPQAYREFHEKWKDAPCQL